MAENPASKELQTAQQQSLTQQSGQLGDIRNILLQANFPAEWKKEQDQSKGIQKTLDDTEKQHKKRAFDAGKHVRDSHGHFIKQTNLLQKVSNGWKWMKKFTMEEAKKALALASKLKIDTIAKGMADKATKFAGSLLDLLLKGLGLAALWALLDWIADQDWAALYEEHKASIMEFWDALKLVGATVAGWATAAWIIDGPLHKLWRGIKAIFEGGGKFTLLVTKVIGWASHLMFDPEKGVLSKLWTGIKAIFGGLGKFGELVKIVTKWTGHLMFDIGKGSLGLLWTALKSIFAVGGTIAVLLDDVQSKWTGTKMFGPDGALRKAWASIKTIFGFGDDGIVKKLLTKVDEFKKVTWFGPDGNFQKAWSGIKTLFGSGKEALIQKMLTFVDGIKDAKMFGVDGPFQKAWAGIKGIFGKDGKIGKFLTDAIDVINNPDIFGETGPFRKAWKGIKGIFGSGGKIAQGWAILQDAEDWVGEKSDIKGMFNGMKKIFGAEGSIGKGWKTVKATFGNFFGPSSPIDEVMKSFNTMFGPESTIGKFVGGAPDGKTPSGPGFIQKIKNIFSAEGAVGKLFGIFGQIGDAFTGVGKTIMDSGPVKIMKKVFGFALKIGKAAGGAALAVGGTVLATVGRIFAPLGWIMAIFEGVSGFIKGFQSTGTDDTRTFGEKLSDGFKGAIDALIQFFVVDLLELIEGMINWGIKKLNEFLPSWMLPDGGIKEVSFAEGIGDAIKGVTDATVDAVAGATSSDDPEKQALVKQAMARKMMSEMGIGKYDSGIFSDQVDINSKNLAAKLKAMSPEELGKISKAMDIASEGKAEFDVDGKDWRQVLADEMSSRSADARASAAAAAAAPIIITKNEQNSNSQFSGNGSAASPKKAELTEKPGT